MWQFGPDPALESVLPGSHFAQPQPCREGPPHTEPLNENEERGEEKRASMLGTLARYSIVVIQV